MANLTVKVGLNSAGFKTGLAKLKATAISFRSSLGGMMSGLGGQILGALGLTAGVAGLGMLTRSAIDAGSKISDLGTQLRIGTTELQTLQSISLKAGVSQMELEKSLRSIQQKTMEAADGNETYRDSFKRLGINLNDFVKMPLEKKLSTIANAYKSSGESLASFDDISTILGSKTGPKMLEVLDRISTEGFENLQTSAIEAGQVMDEATVAALDRAADEIGRWQNRIIVGFGTFLADIGSSFGRQKWGLIVGQKLAQVGEFVENSIRSIANYVLATFATVGRYLNGQFGNIIAPIRNALIDCLMYIGDALATFFGYFDSGWERAVKNAVKNLNTLRKESNKLAEQDKGKSFSEIWGDELINAESKNKSRKRSDLWSSGSVDWYDDEIARAERLRNIQKKAAEEAEKARKAKYAKSDSNIEIKESAKAKADRKKEANREKGYNDSSLAKIGGGGLTAARFNVSEKQLSEAKKQSKLLTKIAENTEDTNKKTELLMK